MNGDIDPQYVRARQALLDGLTALAPHLDSIVVIVPKPFICTPGPPTSPLQS